MAPVEERHLDEGNRRGRSRVSILEEAKRLITEDRNKAYGEPKENHERIARGWSLIFNFHVTAHQVALAMMWLKICRLIVTPDHRDSHVDICGYAANGWECLDDEK